MKRSRLLLLAMLGLLLAAPFAAALEVPINTEHDPPVVEWFHGEGSEDALERLEQEAAEGRIRLLHWRLDAEEVGSNFPDDDARLRADTLGVASGPAVAVNGVVLSDLEEDTLDTALDGHASREVLTFSGTVGVLEADGDLAVLIRGTVTPQENLSEHVIVLVTLTEDGALDRHGRTATHLVRDMRPEVAFGREAGNASDVLWTMTPDHLEAAGVDLSGHGMGYHLSLIVVEHGVVLQSHTQTLPNPTTDMDRSAALVVLPLTSVVVVVLVLILRGEMKTDQALPAIGAVPWDGQGKVQVMVQAGTSPCTVTGIEAEPPWKVAGRSLHRDVAQGELDVIEVRPSRGGDAPLRLRLSIEVEGEGGWVQSLDVERTSEVSKRS
ncbi:MAG: hypothetical protein QF839_04020 [Candidatus Poseidoniaceae archaeon]|nr:hypothetical protein [Candidatus Poseidoniaceae archaeon]